MRSVINFCILLAFTFSTYAQNNADWKNLGLKGKVKSVTISQNYRYKKNGVDFTPWEKQYTNIYQFERSGLYSEYRQLLANGSLNYRISYSYNSKEKKGEQAFFDKDDKPTIKKSMLYNNTGKIIELVEYTRDGLRDRSYKYMYDQQGNNTEIIYYTQDNSLGSKTTMTYDANGNAKDIRIETPGYADSYKKFTCDSKGNRIGESWIDADNTISYRFVRSYNTQGDIIEELTYKEGDILAGKSTWKYEYDKQGNWIKKTNYDKDGIDFNIEERTIIYY